MSLSLQCPSEQELAGAAVAAMWRVYGVCVLAKDLLHCLTAAGTAEALGSSPAYRIVASCSAALGPGADSLLALRQLVERRPALQPAQRREATKLALHLGLANLMIIQALLGLGAERLAAVSDAQLAKAVRSTLCRPEKVRRLLGAALPPLAPAQVCTACVRVARSGLAPEPRPMGPLLILAPECADPHLPGQGHARAGLGRQAARCAGVCRAERCPASSLKAREWAAASTP